jgi:hypothetical protein
VQQIEVEHIIKYKTTLYSSTIQNKHWACNGILEYFKYSITFTP